MLLLGFKPYNLYPAFGESALSRRPDPTVPPRRGDPISPLVHETRTTGRPGAPVITVTETASVE